MSLTAVGFDLDDTLAVTTRSRERLLAEACERVGAPDISRAAYLDAHDAHSGGATREPVFEALLADRDSDVDPSALARAYRDRVEAALVSVPGAAAAVRAVNADHRVGLLTDGPSDTQYSKLERLGWTDRFDAVVVTGTLPAAKPDPRAFEALCAELDAAPDATAYVGDHPTNDVGGAAAAGLLAVQVTYPDGPAPDPEADAIVPREALDTELPDVINSL